jgi:hypothetical protein
MPLAEVNHHLSWSSIWMPLAETDQQSQPGHPSRMPLAEANHHLS